MKLLVCGGRGYADHDMAFEVLWKVGPSVVIHGAAPGADTLASRWATSSGTREIPVRAEWSKDGKAADPIRNQRMLDEHSPDMVLAFPGGRRTEDMVRRSRRAGVPVLRVEP